MGPLKVLFLTGLCVLSPVVTVSSLSTHFLLRSTSSLSQDLMLERFSRGKAKFDKPVSIPSPGE